MLKSPMGAKQLFCLVAGIALCGGALGWMYCFEALVSFEVGFVGFMCVVISSFVAILKRVQAHTQTESAQDTQAPESTQEVDSEPRAQKHSKFIIGTQISFSFFRLLSYACFAGALVALMRYEKFHLWSFLIGMVVAMIVLLSLGVYVFYTKRLS